MIICHAQGTLNAHGNIIEFLQKAFESANENMRKMTNKIMEEDNR